MGAENDDMLTSTSQVSFRFSRLSKALFSLESLPLTPIANDLPGLAKLHPGSCLARPFVPRDELVKTKHRPLGHAYREGGIVFLRVSHLQAA
jgi:hypothetical protein